MTDEKDDLVERCAKVLRDQNIESSPGSARVTARTVLETAGIERLRAERDEAMSDIQQCTAHSAALNSKLEGEKKLSALMKERIAKLELVSSQAAAVCSYNEANTIHGAAVFALRRALNALESLEQPAGTPSTGPGQSLGGQEPAGCSSPVVDPQVIRDIVTVVLDLRVARGESQETHAAAERLKERYRYR